MLDWQIRPANADDCAAAADLWLAARRAGVGSIPAPARSDDDVRSWMRDVVFADREVWLAADGAAVVGLLVLDDTWLDQLYVAPGRTGQGLGTALLELAKHRRPHGFGLWVFASNRAAQRFYHRHGLVEVERTDGRDNEEQAPDVHYAWCPTAVSRAR